MADCQKRVFIVDDDGGVGRALMILLTSYGFRAEAFASAKDFFISVPAGCPGCLILDIHMPGADGWKTLAQFARSEEKRPVILMSGDMSEKIQERALKSGVIGFLQKPFADLALLNLLNRAFTWGKLK